ncbi:hypothetical protein F4X86_03275 [Candidatus Saccharibacteria bacterium]|nr:hypothetical protein [Candidatus Saccharibacteria bacterium]
MISPLFISASQQITDEDGLNYKISVERELSDSSQTFLATNNELEQIHRDVFSSEPNQIGQSVAIANENLIAAGTKDSNDLLTVQILEKSSGEWQETYSFSYETASTTNYEIPSAEIPADADDLLFGESLAFHGNNLLAVGAPGWQGPTIDDDTSTTDTYEADDGTNRGAVYIFQRSGNTWSLVSTVRGTEPKGQFGSSVGFSPAGVLAIGASSSATYNNCPRYDSGNTYTVPANEDTDGDNDVDEDDTTTTRYISVACPAVYVYERDGSQGVAQWNKTKTITVAADKASFGGSVAFGGEDLLAIGASGQYAPNRVSGEGYTRRPGAVHLYAKDSNDDWAEELVISDFNTTTPGSGEYQVELEDLDYFGQAVGFIDSTTLVASVEYQGTLMVFEESAGSWSKVADIKGHELLAGIPPVGSENDRAGGFGNAIDTHDDLIAVTQDGSQGSINLLKWSTFQAGTTWHYVYIDDANCDAGDFNGSPTAYTEGDVITPGSDKEGKHLCFKADDGTNTEYFASRAIDLTGPGLEDPALNVSEDGVLSIYFNEQVRQLDDTDIDESWVSNKVDSLEITPNGETNATTVSLSSTGRLVSVGHENGKTVLRLQLDTSSFPLSSDPTAAAPHDYSITMYDLEDFDDNATATLTAEQEITEYASSTPTITITEGSDQSIIVTDSLASGESTLSYVWQSQDDACDNTTDFSSPYSYAEGVSIRLEEAHNGRQICFRSVNNGDTSLENYKAYDVDGIDRTAPTLTTTMTTTTLSASDDDDEANTWSYVVVDDDTCDSSVDFSSATTYTEDADLTIDTTDTSSEANKYYCFRSVDDQDNTGYGMSSQIAGSPRIKKITVSNSLTNLFGAGRELIVKVHFDEAVVVTGGGRSIYLRMNSQTSHDFGSLNELKSGRFQDYDNGLLAFSYFTQADDFTNSLEVLEIVVKSGNSIKDADGNDAILDLTGIVIVDDNDQPRDIKIDGRKPTVTLTQPDFSTLETSKKISAVDDYAGNDNNWDYYFITPEQLNDNTANRPADIRCRLGDFLPKGQKDGTPYREGDDITLTDEHNGHYLCVRSRRAEQDLWDRSNSKDRGGAVSALITNIDSSPPVITTRVSGNTLTVNVKDESAIDSSSLIYKLIGAEEDCDATALGSGTSTYADGDNITIEEEFYGSRFCFTATDELGNTAYHPSQILTRPRPRQRTDTTPPNIIVTDPDNTDPARTRTVSAMSDSSDTDENSWRWKAFDPAEDDCDSDLMGSGINIYDSGQTVTLDSENFNGLQICFSVADDNGNTAYAATTTVTGIDRTAPGIIITANGNQISAVDDDAGQTRWRYSTISISADCSLIEMVNSQAYQEGTILTLTQAGSKICFEVQDAAGNTNYQDSTIIAPLQADAPPVADVEEVLNVGEIPEVPEPKDELPKIETRLTELAGDDSADGFNGWSLLLLGLVFPLALIIIFFRRRSVEANG